LILREESTMPTSKPFHDSSRRVLDVQELAVRIAQGVDERGRNAGQRLIERLAATWEPNLPFVQSAPANALQAWQEWPQYTVDFGQRTVLFWDTLRQRGNNFLAHERAGKPILLHFQHETICDGRTFERPVNYVLLRIIPPPGVEVDPKRRPYVIIDPRAGHGPGVGGFKDDSQVGTALHEGHPVYFVSFFPEPVPGQTLLDVSEAEARFVKQVRERHPDSPKPVIIGNCQGGWAAMMLAASHPDDTGPIVINGAPMSYWSGAWREGDGDNPMRYSGGMLGGGWLASLTSDLGNGTFDGAWLVQNFENLNPANTWVDKYHNLFANVDTEPPRFLEFERWWGGYYLMNREEIEWIVRNLFVGNQLWTGREQAANGRSFDLRQIKSPIIMFASLGDNITPPQQAFNWVADVYGSTDEIKARGQVIVGLMHEDAGHLGIFVSGKVARKEYKQIVSVLKSIEALPPGLYGMQIEESKAADGRPIYDVRFEELQLEQIAQDFNRYQREDEKAFQAVKAVADFNQHAYELFAKPLAQALSNEHSATLLRTLHPLRAQRWAFSDLNPWVRWLEPAAAAVKAQRRPVGPDSALRKLEQAISETWSAAFDWGRAVRDAATEAAFFAIYGTVFYFYLADRPDARQPDRPQRDARELPVVKEALATIDRGGYVEAFERIAALVAGRGEPLPLHRLQSQKELLEDYRELLPQLAFEARRLIRGEQDIIVRYEPEQALATLPRLLSQPGDRQKMLTLLDTLLADERFLRGFRPTDGQLAVLERIRGVLGSGVLRLGNARRALPAEA
jgi:pimeloyl-ACP methyl ester carboxylesterase